MRDARAVGKEEGRAEVSRESSCSYTRHLRKSRSTGRGWGDLMALCKRNSMSVLLWRRSSSSISSSPANSIVRTTLDQHSLLSLHLHISRTRLCSKPSSSSPMPLPKWPTISSLHPDRCHSFKGMRNPTFLSSSISPNNMSNSMLKRQRPSLSTRATILRSTSMQLPKSTTHIVVELALRHMPPPSWLLSRICVQMQPSRTSSAWNEVRTSVQWPTRPPPQTNNPHKVSQTWPRPVSRSTWCGHRLSIVVVSVLALGLHTRTRPCRTSAVSASQTRLDRRYMRIPTLVGPMMGLMMAGIQSLSRVIPERHRCRT